MSLKRLMTIVVLMLCTIHTQSTSKYEGLSWNEEKKRWQVEFDFHGKTSKYYFDNESDAIKTMNRSSKKMGILSPLNSESCEIPNQKQKEKTSEYKGVTKQNGKWCVQLRLKGEKKYGGTFNDELDAAKRVNELCKEFGTPEKNPGINGIPNQHCKAKEKTSQYIGVAWHKENKKWTVRFDLKGQLPKYGGSFNDELEAAKRVNELCKEFGIPEKNPGIGIPNQHWKAKGKTSQYKGVHWNRGSKKWHAGFYSKDRKWKHGGSFSKELDAAKRVNQLCEQFKISEKNPGIGTIQLRQWQAKEKTSQYKGVYWHKNNRKWYAVFRSTDGKFKHCGSFSDELNAAKTINQLCEESGIPESNPGIGKMPLQCKAQEKTSQYNGVHWNQNRKKWYAVVYSKNGKWKYGGSFSNELDAAKRVNQLCEEIGILEKNPGIGTMQPRQWQHKVNHNIVFEEKNSVMDSDIIKTDDSDGTKEKKKNPINNFIIDDKSSFKQYYFHEDLLK